jgi:hypothetical protein
MGRPAVHETTESHLRVDVREGKLRGVALEWVRCGFGGKRPLFRCPNCGERRGVLYFRNEALACRRCHRLTYESQRVSPEYRLLRKRNAILARLGAVPGGELGTVPKPPRMRWKTFQRLVIEARTADVAALRAAARRWR